MKKFALIVLIAVSASIISLLLAKSFEAADHLHVILYAYNPLIFLLWSPLFFLLASEVVYRFSPTSSGSGIHEVVRSFKIAKEHDGNLIPTYKLLNIKAALVKFFSALIALIGGASLGREGPTVFIATTIFVWISAVFVNLQKTLKEALIIAGGACGLAAAFNTPIAGIAFAIEEIGHNHFSRHKNTMLTAIIISAVSAWLITGEYLYFGSPHIESTKIIQQLTIAVINGSIAGISGLLFVKAILYGSKRIALLPKSIRRYMIPLLGGLIIAAIALSSDAKTLGSGYLLTKEALNQGLSFATSFAPLKFIATFVTYLSGAAGGIFAPSLAVGVGIGNIIANLFSFDSLVLSAILAMAGYFAAITQAPLTTFIIVIEMTAAQEFIIPIMVASYIGYGVSCRFQPRSFYSELAARIQLPKLTSNN